MKTIELIIDDQLHERVSALAASKNYSVQELLIDLIRMLDETRNSETGSPSNETEYDPITPLIGSLNLETQDLAEQHDRYIGQALYRETKGEE